jgi:hypothetical protein
MRLIRKCVKAVRETKKVLEVRKILSQLRDAMS